MKKFVVFLLLFHTSIGAKILGVTYVPCTSHQSVYNSVWQELAKRGHEVTVFTPFPQKNSTLKNLREISPNDEYQLILKEEASLHKMMLKELFITEIYQNLINYFAKLAEQQIIAVETMFRNKSMNFDVIIVEALHPIIFAVACRLKVPIIVMSSLDVLTNTYDSVGNPIHPLVMPNVITNYISNDFFNERLSKMFVSIWFRIYYHWYVLPSSNKIVKKIYPKCPHLGSIENNVSLILSTNNPILHFARPHVPAVIYLRQLHLKPQKSLPLDLQIFLDNSLQGVIYFSLGSTLKSSLLRKPFKQVIVDAVRHLPYNFLLKWDSCSELQIFKNVLCKEWLPQQDVLSHKNIKVFVFQGGLQSLEESIASGVPLVGLPFIADQPLQVLKIIELGIGLGIDPMFVTEENLRGAIVEVAENIKYKERTLEVKKLLEDQPMKSLDTAIWWIEYVIRHKGARHLRSPLIDMPWYRYFMVDVISFVLVVLIMILFALYKLIKLPILLYRRHKKNKTKKE